LELASSFACGFWGKKRNRVGLANAVDAMTIGRTIVVGFADGQTLLNVARTNARIVFADRHGRAIRSVDTKATGVTLTFMTGFLGIAV